MKKVSCACVANFQGRCAAECCKGEILAFTRLSSAEQAKRFYEMALFVFEEEPPCKL